MAAKPKKIEYFDEKGKKRMVTRAEYNRLMSARRSRGERTVATAQRESMESARRTDLESSGRGPVRPPTPKPPRIPPGTSPRAPVPTAAPPVPRQNQYADIAGSVAPGQVIDERQRALMGDQSREGLEQDWLRAVRGRRLVSGYSYWNPRGAPDRQALGDPRSEMARAKHAQNNRTPDGRPLTPIEVMDQLAKMNPEELKRLQSKLYMAGHYSGIIDPTSPELPQWGVLDSNTIAAAGAFFKTVGPHFAMGNFDIDELLDQQAAGQVLGGGPAGKVNADGSISTATTTVESKVVGLISDEEVTMTGDEIGMKLLGRRLKPEERAALKGIINSRLMGAAEQAASQEEAAFATNAASEAEAHVNANISVNGEITPGTAGAMAATLSKQYGLNVTSGYRSPAEQAALNPAVKSSSHTTGYGYDVAGDPNKMRAFYEWAKANSGPGKIFKTVILEGTGAQGAAGFSTGPHVHMEFNTSAVAGPGGGPGDPASLGAGATSTKDIRLTGQENVNEQALMEEELKRRNPVEYDTHQHVENYDTLISTLGGTTLRGGVGVS